MFCAPPPASLWNGKRNAGRDSHARHSGFAGSLPANPESITPALRRMDSGPARCRSRPGMTMGSSQRSAGPVLNGAGHAGVPFPVSPVGNGAPGGARRLRGALWASLAIGRARRATAGRGCEARPGTRAPKTKGLRDLPPRRRASRRSTVDSCAVCARSTAAPLSGAGPVRSAGRPRDGKPEPGHSVSCI